MFSFKFFYLEACDSLKIKPNEKLLYKIEQSGNSSNLNLSDIELTDDNCKAIGHALSKDVFLQGLDISNCMLSDDGLSSILSGIEANKFLLTLNLKGNNIKSIGTALIGKLLRHNNHLQNLCLEWNGTGIFPEKFSYLCEGLNANTSLQSLDLRNNQLNHICAQSLSEVIYRNSTLQNLDLRWNSIGLIGGRALLKSLGNNKSILNLHITGNDVPFEIEKAIELVTSAATERYIRNKENLEKTKFFACKLQDLELQKDKQLRSLMEELEKRDKGIELSDRWNMAKLTQLQEKITEKDDVIEDLIKKSKELSRQLSIVTEEKNSIAMSLNEMEVNCKESKKEFQFLLNKERQEKEDMERKFLEEIGTIKEENLFLKKQIQEYKISQEDLEDQIIKLKNTVSKTEKKLKLEEQSFQEQTSLLNENHQEKIREIDQIRKSEISMMKEEFLEVEKNLKQRIKLLENRRNDLEKQIIEKEAQIMETKALAEEKVEELKIKMKNDEEKLKKQMEERIELLESANKKKDELLKEDHQAMLEIKKICTENDLLLAEEAHKTQQLLRRLESKDDETNATIAKIKLEVKEQLEELSQVKTSLENSLAENTSLKQKITELKKEHKEEIKNKEEEMKNLKYEVKKQKSKEKEILLSGYKQISDLQSAFTSYLNSEKLEDDDNSEDK